jgi:hypothetical protein
MGWRLEGVALMAYDGQACRLDYEISCDPQWVTKSASVTGWVGNQQINASVSRDDAGVWHLNGRPADGLGVCSDIDLNFSPSTNLLPIRRLDLEIGESATMRAAWLRFPSFALEPLEQSYSRLASNRYRYESAGGRFVTEIDVDDAGLVIDYGDIWAREAAS